MATTLMTQAQTAHKSLSATESDPVKMGWMMGSPPPADKMVKLADGSHFRFPQIWWSIANMRQIIPTTNVPRGDSATAVLPRAERVDIDAMTFHALGRSDTMTWADVPGRQLHGFHCGTAPGQDPLREVL